MKTNALARNFLMLYAIASFNICACPIRSLQAQRQRSQTKKIIIGALAAAALATRAMLSYSEAEDLEYAPANIGLTSICRLTPYATMSIPDRNSLSPQDKNNFPFAETCDNCNVGASQLTCYCERFPEDLDYILGDHKQLTRLDLGNDCNKAKGRKVFNCAGSLRLEECSDCDRIAKKMFSKGYKLFELCEKCSIRDNEIGCQCKSQTHTPSYRALSLGGDNYPDLNAQDPSYSFINLGPDCDKVQNQDISFCGDRLKIGDCDD